VAQCVRVIDLNDGFDGFTLDSQIWIAQKSTERPHFNGHLQACQPFKRGQPDTLVGICHEV
jgi:hypothetical protein